MDDFEVDGSIYRRENWFAEIRAEIGRAKAPASRPPHKPPTTPDGLLLPPQAAARLNVTVEQLFALVRDGELRYVNIGRGAKRPRYAFTDADINQLIEKRQTREATCPSIGPKNPRRISGSTSKSLVVGFTALRNAQIARKPKSSKR
jgi:hypothetical protein